MTSIPENVKKHLTQMGVNPYAVGGSPTNKDVNQNQMLQQSEEVLFTLAASIESQMAGFPYDLTASNRLMNSQTMDGPTSPTAGGQQR